MSNWVVLSTGSPGSSHSTSRSLDENAPCTAWCLFPSLSRMYSWPPEKGVLSLLMFSAVIMICTNVLFAWTVLAATVGSVKHHRVFYGADCNLVAFVYLDVVCLVYRVCVHGCSHGYYHGTHYDYYADPDHELIYLCEYIVETEQAASRPWFFQACQGSEFFIYPERGAGWGTTQDIFGIHARFPLSGNRGSCEVGDWL